VEACERFYKKKTLERLAIIRDSGLAYTINGIYVGTLTEIIESVDFESLYTNTFCRFHGDFILENIVRKENGDFVLLDWRHEFDASTPYGDMYYDLAKLRHNIIFNFNNVKAGLFSCVGAGENVTLDLKCNYFLMQQLEDFDQFVLENEYDGKKIKILCALIWINMAALYEGSLRSFLFYFGLYSLRLAQG
jgi:thiamine kinase-like enzyme